MLRGPLKSELRRAIPRIQRSPITYAAASAGLQRPAQPAPRPAAKPRKYEEGKARSALRSPLRTELAQRRSFGRLAEGVAAEVRYTGRGVGSLFCRYPDATFAHTALISTSREIRVNISKNRSSFLDNHWIFTAHSDKQHLRDKQQTYM